MQSAQPSLFTRNDTIFGVCQGLGEDFGFNPRYLRVGFALMLFWNPAAAIGAYLGTGLVVMLARWLYPTPSSSASHQLDAGEAASMQPPAEHAASGDEVDERWIALAAAA